MEKRKLIEAKKLIKAKKFEKAKQVLEPILDNDTAMKWYLQLQQMPDQQATKKTKDKKNNKSIGCVLWVIVIVFIGVMMNTDGGRTLTGATPRPTQNPTATPSDPGAIARYIAEEQMLSDIHGVAVNPSTSSIAINFEMRGNSLRITRLDIANTTCALKATNVFTGYTYDFSAQGQFVDNFGDDVDVAGMKVRLTGSTIDKINCDSIQNINWESIAEVYYVHPALQE